jgi:hypothetical protein
VIPPRHRAWHRNVFWGGGVCRHQEGFVDIKHDDEDEGHQCRIHGAISALFGACHLATPVMESVSKYPPPQPHTPCTHILSRTKTILHIMCNCHMQKGGEVAWSR